MKQIFYSLLLIVLPIQAQVQTETVKLPAELQSFVQENTKPIALETADLNGDGTKDFVLVLEDTSEIADDNGDQGKRRLLIVTRQADGKLALAARNDKAIFCRTCGGIFGDPFEGVEVGPKTLTVHHYGGSAWRWSNAYKFNYSRIDKTWQLVRVGTQSYHTSDPNKVESKIYTPPKHFGKIALADFDPENHLRKNVKQ